MDLTTFRALVDETPAGIDKCAGQLDRLYAYVGLPHQGSMQRSKVGEALHAKISAAFTRGQPKVRRLCQALQGDLIRAHVLDGVPLQPHYEVLNRLADATRGSGAAAEDVEGDWRSAVLAARDSVELEGERYAELERLHPREFAVARAAKTLKDANFAVRLEPGHLSLTKEDERRVIGELEELVAVQGGLNVARRIFEAIGPQYDAAQQRYHLVPRVSSAGGGAPQVPWGYLLHLSVKHIEGRKPHIHSKLHWAKLVGLARAFAAVVDVQPYEHSAIRTFDALGLLAHFQQLALYDTLFRIPQVRPTDVDRLARGMLDFVDVQTPTKGGWTLDEALAVIGYLMDPTRDVRGPWTFTGADAARALRQVPKSKVEQILRDVLSHGPGGANQRFSHPAEAPAVGDFEAGVTFFSKPLLRLSSGRYVLIDRSVCAAACLEALLIALRPEYKQLESRVGLSVERFLEAEFKARNISIKGGDYDVAGEHGECDLVVETVETLFFLELKKKALTRRARAGSDADLLLDLAASLLAAQAQAGWHELRIQKVGALTLTRGETTDRLALNGRTIEKVALSLLDFGSFQDRINLKHFFEATLGSAFMPGDDALAGKFSDLNDSLVEIRKQVEPKQTSGQRPAQWFFNAWFVSVPQLLVLLDGVTNAESFRDSFWAVRHSTTGASDLYFEIKYMADLGRLSS